MSLLQTLIPITALVYLTTFFVFGEEIFDTDFDTGFSGDGGFLDFLGSAFDVAGDLIQFITLTGLIGHVHALVLTVLWLTLGLGWLLVALSYVRGNSVA